MFVSLFTWSKIICIIYVADCSVMVCHNSFAREVSERANLWKVDAVRPIHYYHKEEKTILMFFFCYKNVIMKD